jgi:hypothetical protein
MVTPKLVERTYGSLLAPLGGEPAICAECLFVDPIADIAVLGSPDISSLGDEATAYYAFVESATPIPIAAAPQRGHGWLLSLDCNWFGCSVKYTKRFETRLSIFDTAQPILGGMSGSPIISDDGAAIGVVCLTTNLRSSEGMINPRLVRDLPGWLLHAQKGLDLTEKIYSIAHDLDPNGDIRPDADPMAKYRKYHVGIQKGVTDDLGFTLEDFERYIAGLRKGASK